MAIEILEEKKEESKVLKNEKIIFFGFWALLFILTIGFLIFFIVFYKPKEDLIKTYFSNQNFLTKEEINKLEEILNQIDKSNINKFKPNF
jgi:cell division septal protein FtsQ